MSQSHTASPIGEDGIVRCYTHNLEVRVCVSRTTGNPNRKFYVCSKDRGDPERCSFWYWADDAMFEKLNPITSSPQRSTANQPPASQSTLNVTPKKRALPPSSSPVSTPPTPSQIRLIQMQTALSQAPDPPQSPQMPFAQSCMSSTQSSLTASSPPCSPIQSPNIATHSPLDDMETDDDLFLSSPTSSGSTVKFSRTSEFQFPLVYRNPKRPRIEDHAAEAETGRYMMSPQTPQCEGGLSTPPETPCNGAEGSNSQRQSDRHNPFHKRATSLREHLQSQRPVSAGTSSLEKAPSINTVAEPTADSISALLQGLSNVPAYVSKLERRKLAGEKSGAAKVKRLEDEVHISHRLRRLRRKIRVLEETIETTRGRP